MKEGKKKMDNTLDDFLCNKSIDEDSFQDFKLKLELEELQDLSLLDK